MSVTLKDIRKSIFEIKYIGHQLDSIEAFLIHTDDLVELRNVFTTESGLEINFEDGHLKICGVKLIESPYVQKGTIFKIFKDQTTITMPTSGSISLPDTLPTMPASGFISSPIFRDTSKHNIGESGVIHFPTISMPEVLPPAQSIENNEEEKKVERKHSTTRKIELD